MAFRHHFHQFRLPRMPERAGGGLMGFQHHSCPPPPPSHVRSSRRWSFIVFPRRSHLFHLPCMQEQAGGERSWSTPPSIGMGYLRWVPVELKQRPRLVSAAAVIAFVVNAGTDSFSNWRKWDGVGKEDGCGGQRSGGWEAEKAEFMPLANGWTVVSTISSRCHSHLDAVLTLPVVIVFSLRRQTRTLSIICSRL